MKREQHINDSKRESRKEFWQVFTVVAISMVFFVCMIVGFIHLDKARYNECFNNPPDTNYVEEDLEDVFMTTGVIVYDERQEETRIYYKVEANGLNYKVLYVMKHPDIFYYRWGYERHIEIREEIEEDLDYAF